MQVYVWRVYRIAAQGLPGTCMAVLGYEQRSKPATLQPISLLSDLKLQTSFNGGGYPPRVLELGVG